MLRFGAKTKFVGINLGPKNGVALLVLDDLRLPPDVCIDFYMLACLI